MPKTQRVIRTFEAINEALLMSMKKNKKIILIGLGVDDPKGIFGTTKNIEKNLNPRGKRVFDFPTAENAMTGIALGASINGMVPIITHQRVEFSLLSVEQIFNQVAKWYFMSAGKKNVPLVIRLIIGRGWGQGPQHSQSLESVFSHIPGLKVVTLSTPRNSKGLLISSIKDKNPVIIFEHRWIHNLKGEVPKSYYEIPIGKSNVLKKGKDITLISNSYTITECLRAYEILKKNFISVEIIDLQSLRPLDCKTIIKSVQKTKKALIIDNSTMSYGVSSEIYSRLIEGLKIKNLKNYHIDRIGPPDIPTPSTRALAKFCYVNYIDIIKSVEKILKIKITKYKKNSKNVPHDKPYEDFTGPF